ncbi:MAG: DNA-J related domain-containing protein [Ketobacteraceae bacterium]|nr:DNA-J related domain-containing protein [Ketobacteraceae bacterium]
MNSRTFEEKQEQSTQGVQAASEKAALVNPFVMDVLRILRQRPGGVKIYELLSGLDQELVNQVVDTEDYNLSIFRKNFLLMNALYQLQLRLLKDNLYLSIGQIEVQLLPTHQVNQKKLTNAGEQRIREYYFNWKNYEKTRSDDVIALLESFWNKYRATDKLTEALIVLGVTETTAWPEIQRKYRSLARENHPDKGGDTQRFIEIREAYEVLAVHYKK